MPKAGVGERGLPYDKDLISECFRYRRRMPERRRKAEGASIRRLVRRARRVTHLAVDERRLCRRVFLDREAVCTWVWVRHELRRAHARARENYALQMVRFWMRNGSHQAVAPACNGEGGSGGKRQRRNRYATTTSGGTAHRL
jgi:hypothetical protein